MDSGLKRVIGQRKEQRGSEKDARKRGGQISEKHRSRDRTLTENLYGIIEFKVLQDGEMIWSRLINLRAVSANMAKKASLRCFPGVAFHPSTYRFCVENND